MFASICVAAFALLVRRLIASQDGRRLMWLVVGMAGSTGSVLFYAVASYALHRNLHGRYILGLYLPVLFIIAQGIADIAAAPTARWRRFLSPGILGTLIAVHAYCVAVVLKRFF